MRILLQATSWFAIIIGILAIIGSINPVDGYGLFGGVLFFSQGALSIIYVRQFKVAK